MKRTETKELDVDFIDDPSEEGKEEREAALGRAFTQHDTLEFDGMELRPITGGTMDLMAQANCRMFHGDQTRLLRDCAAFILLHQADTGLSRRARRILYADPLDFEEEIFQFLDKPGIVEKITEFAPVLSKMMADFTGTQTTALASGDTKGSAKKKSGRPTG